MQKNYFRYLPETGLADQWGMEITAAGCTRVRAGQRYPSGRHPADHDFTFARGRVLHAYQMIFISEGQGEFESLVGQHDGVCEGSGVGEASDPDSERVEIVESVSAGQVILLLPGVWHRYRPDATTGWVEHWIEGCGPVLDRMHRDGLLRADRPIVMANDAVHLLSCFESIHRWVNQNGGQRRVDLSTLGMHMYSMLRCGGLEMTGVSSAIGRAVRRAQLLIAQRAHLSLNVRALADELGVAYSYFRKSFCDEVGIAPKQYHVQLRLRKAQGMLANTGMTVTQVADALGYDSPYHLSQQFKRHVGMAPNIWRSRGRASEGALGER